MKTWVEKTKHKVERKTLTYDKKTKKGRTRNVKGKKVSAGRGN